MELLKIVVGLLVAFVMLCAMIGFNRFSIEKFGHQFFGWPKLLLGAAAAWAIALCAGSAGTSTAALAAVAAGAAVLLVLVISNVRRTSLAFGMGGSVVQLVAFAAMGVLGVFAIPLLFFGLVMGTLGGVSRPRRYGYDDWD